MQRYVRNADAYVFSRAGFAWDGLDPHRVAVIHPSIDPFSAKNQDQTPAQSLAILTSAGVVADGGRNMRCSRTVMRHPGGSTGPPRCSRRSR